MEKKLIIYTCSFLIPEISHIFKNGDYGDVQLSGYQATCALNTIDPKLLVEKVYNSSNPNSDIYIIGSSCQSVNTKEPKNEKITHIHLEQCFEIFLNKEIATHYIAQGYYLVTNGWLKMIEQHIKNWGFDKETAKIYFGESMKKILLLDTQIGGDYLPNLKKLSEYMGLPYEILPIGLSYCKIFIDQLIYSWRNKIQNLNFKKKFSEVSKQTADYSIIFNRLESIVNLTDEKQIVEVGFELINILYAPSNLAFTKHINNHKERFEFIGISNNLSSDTRNSFELEIYQANYLLGIFEVNGVQFPQFINEYKKTGEILKYLFGLAISNARKYQINIEQKERLEMYSLDLKEANVTKDKFFSIIAHDLKSSFNSILGFVNLLHTDYDIISQEKIKKYISLLHKSSNNTYNLLENLLIWARSQHGKIQIKKESILLKGFVNQSIEAYLINAENKQIEVKNEIPENLELIADKFALGLIYGNLFSNAIKFTPRGGIISFKVNIENDNVKLCIEDNGVGMDSDEQNMLFQIDKSPTTIGTENETGTGLGLILCKEFVEKHNGKIWVESKKGVGSTFYFTIPNKELTYRDNIINEDIKSEIITTKNILIAEDEETNFLYVQAVLDRYPFNLIHVVNGKEAVEFMQNTNNIDLILMDFNMPIMSGLDATIEIRKINPTIPILALTAYSMMADKEKALDIGCTDYISKPVSPEVLLETINEYI